MPGKANKPLLTLETLRAEAKKFSDAESTHREPALFGVTDGKAVGTYLEHKFQGHLRDSYSFPAGNSAKGVDFPELAVDIKVTSVKQPQSSCPFSSARQKVYGLGYHLIVFVYDKKDNPRDKTAILNLVHTIFVEKELTGDYQTTSGLLKIVKNDGNIDDVIAFFEERMLPVDEITARNLAEEVLKSPPKVGYLTISNALQWRLQYRRVIDNAGQVPGLMRIR